MKLSALFLLLPTVAFGVTVESLSPPQFVDTEVSANTPAWLYDRNWNLMQLTARGTDVQGERFEVDVRSSGFLIHLK